MMSKAESGEEPAVGSSPESRHHCVITAQIFTTSFLWSAHLILYWNPYIVHILSNKERWLVVMICFEGASANHCWSLFFINCTYIIYVSIPSRINPTFTTTWWTYNLKIYFAISLFSSDFHSILKIVLFSFISKNIEFLLCAKHSLTFLSSLKTLGYNW